MVCQTTVRLRLGRQLQDQAADAGSGYRNGLNQQEKGQRKKQCLSEL